MKNNSFGNLLWSSALDTWGAVVSLVGVGLAFASYFFPPSTEVVALKWLLIVISISLMLIVILARSAWEGYSAERIMPPKVIYVKDPPRAFTNAFALFLTEPTNLFSFDAIVSIYYREDGVEKLVGIGRVINVQDDFKVQILVFKDYDFGGHSTAIMENSKDALGKLLVKSSIPSFLLEDLADG